MALCKPAYRCEVVLTPFDMFCQRISTVGIAMRR
jgi:hypothetical protein